MASPVDLASDSWHDALKIRKLLMRNLQKLHDANHAAIEPAYFEAIDTCLDRFRLACVSTIFHDFDYAVSQNVEEALWATHVAIKTEYGNILARVQQQPSRSVEHRKVAKLYSNFLSVAHYFYKTYIQRLNARYGIDELKRAAVGIQVQPSTAKDTIRVVPEALRAKVLTSCHHTLIRLGDLSRYRIQGNAHSSSSASAALAYYGLAHHLEPQSGYALHQMGIVHLNQGNHLNIVYHFYRAWTVDKPNPLAKPNLEREFKALLSGQPIRRSVPPAAMHGEAKALDALAMWFVQLHAHFYRGQAFGPKQKELEKEVLHRLETMSRSRSSRYTLLRMSLINIAALYVSGQRYNENQTDRASALFYQYTLCFNIRFVLILCAHIKTELEDKEGSPADDNVDSDVGPDTFLPVLRIYCLWLAAHRREVFGAIGIFGDLVPNMTQALARLFTMLCLETYHQENMQSAPYLLEEDIDIRGFLPLTKERLPEACRVFCDETGNSKPYPPPVTLRLSISKSWAARILDILRCAYFFTEAEEVPLTYRIEENTLLFDFQPAKPNLPACQPANLPANSSQPANQPVTAGQPDDPPARPSQPAPDSREEAAVQEAQTAPDDPAPAPGDSHADAHDETAPELSPQETFDISSYEASSDIDDAVSTVINMLTPFLKPPEPQSHHHPRSPAESFYGSAANEVLFADVGPTPTKSISSGRFEPLPWGWFNTPNPNQSEALSAGRDAFDKYQASPRASVAASKLPEDPFATPGRSHFHTFGQNVMHETAASSEKMGTAEEAHRERLLQSFGAPSLMPTSAFSPWSRHAVPVAAPAGWDPRAFDNSGTSAFSPSSSLYHGTPIHGARHNGPSQAGAGRESGQLSGRQFQVDRTTSSYDEAILKAAYLGRR